LLRLLLLLLLLSLLMLLLPLLLLMRLLLLLLLLLLSLQLLLMLMLLLSVRFKQLCFATAAVATVDVDPRLTAVCPFQHHHLEATSGTATVLELRQTKKLYTHPLWVVVVYRIGLPINGSRMLTEALLSDASICRLQKTLLARLLTSAPIASANLPPRFRELPRASPKWCSFRGPSATLPPSFRGFYNAAADGNVC